MENRRRNEGAGYEDAYHAGYRFHYDLHRRGRNGFRGSAVPHMLYDCRRTADVHMGREMEPHQKGVMKQDEGKTGKADPFREECPEEAH